MNILNMLNECSQLGFGCWDQVIVDQYNLEQKIKGGLLIQIYHDIDEALAIVAINSNT